MQVIVERAWIGWTAIDDDTFDGVPDGECTRGWGMTAAEAAKDLTDRLDDEALL